MRIEIVNMTGTPVAYVAMRPEAIEICKLATMKGEPLMMYDQYDEDITTFKDGRAINTEKKING